MNYNRKNPAELHVAQYSSIMDYINNRTEKQNVGVGSIYILPSSFIGSPRALKQSYQDTMAICDKFGKPTLFFTFASNPKWIAITVNIQNHSTPSDRSNLVARVFHIKKKELVDDIEKCKLLGFVTARIHVIEFQKCGLPHCHMLI